MENKQIAEKIKLLGQIQELYNINPFKTKALSTAAYTISKYPVNLRELDRESLSQIQGFGTSILAKIIELLETNDLQELNEWLGKTPEGVVEMLKIKGLGPKKAQILWKVLNLESVGEVLYACNENRLIEAKGFGLKTQEQIRDSIQFSLNNSGWYLFANTEKTASEWFEKLSAYFGSQVSVTGAFRRKNEILQEVEIVCAADTSEFLEFLVKNDIDPEGDDQSGWKITGAECCPVRIYLTSDNEFASKLFQTTGNDAHVAAVLELQTQAGSSELAQSEHKIYANAGLSYIEPELREGYGEIEKAKNQELPKLIELQDLKGALHNHSTYSDGVQSLREMAIYCRDVLGLEYLGIADHSKTAVYAKGLSIQSVLQQWAEIDLLNQELAPFKIFKGIESDILTDGSLDYPEEILAGFDFVVASIHSNLQMDQEKATGRLIKAISNPYTTILGHPTGRLLLSRKGYSIDHKAIIDACAEHGVVIEINANPLRLDLDWRWYQYAVSQGVLLSINPDAHRTAAFHDMKYGVNVARKGGLSAEFCLNSFSSDKISSFFDNRKK